MFFKAIPPAEPTESIMTHEEAIVLISLMEQGIFHSNDPGVKAALTMAKAALITERLNLLR